MDRIAAAVAVAAHQKEQIAAAVVVEADVVAAHQKDQIAVVVAVEVAHQKDQIAVVVAVVVAHQTDRIVAVAVADVVAAEVAEQARHHQNNTPQPVAHLP
jgi:hypothetical protein